MINKGMFTSNTDLWSTPREFFNKLNKEFRFNLDPCATKENATCKKYFTTEEDGLKQNWDNKIVFMNPPYGDPQNPCKFNCNKKKCIKRGFHTDIYIPGIKDFIKKASQARGGVVVCLLPARTDTRYFHEYIYQKTVVEIRFIKGRLKFGDSKNSAPFPSMIVIFRNK